MCPEIRWAMPGWGWAAPRVGVVRRVFAWRCARARELVRRGAGCAPGAAQTEEAARCGAASIFYSLGTRLAGAAVFALGIVKDGGLAVSLDVLLELL